METHSTYKDNEDYIAHKILDVLIEHTMTTIFQIFMFMSDKSMDSLCDRIVEQKDKIQSVRVKDIKEE